MVASSIGKTAPTATQIFRTAGLTPFRQILTPELFREAFPGRSAGKTILIPEVVVWLMACVTLAQTAMAGAISSLWSHVRTLMPQLPMVPVTEEAFTKARQALRLRFFMTLFALVVGRFASQFGHRYRWKGMRLLGIDGTEVELPSHPRLRRIYPPSSNQHGQRGLPQGRLVSLVGLADGLCHGFRWTSLAVSEQTSANRLIKTLRRTDLLLADRNFPDLERMAAVRAAQADFLFHLPSNRFLNKPRIATPSSRKDQWYADLKLPAQLRKRYPQLGPSIRVRILQYQIPGFRPSWLITSLLDDNEFPYEDLVQLYHRRWRQETSHLEWKHTLQLNNLRSHSASGLLKEVLVQLTLNNVIRWIMAQAAPPELTPVQLCFLQSKRLIMAQVPVMAAAPTWLLPRLYQQLLDEIAKQRILVRPGRSYPRAWDAKGRPKGHGKTAAPAKLTPVKVHCHAAS